MSLDREPYFDRQGRPMGLLEWAQHIEDREYAVVAQHWVRGWMVSTVWLGIDHGFATMFGGGLHVPVIFETMVFPPGDEAGEHGVMSEEYCERYATEAAAQAGHDRALAAMTGKLGGPAAAMEIMSAAQFGDAATAPDDPGDLT